MVQRASERGEIDMFFNEVHHVAIIVSDYEKSRAFYVDKLELPIIRENYREDREDYKSSPTDDYPRP